jgi:hypothetical protein
MGIIVDREMAKSRIDSTLETTAARQAHYVTWCKIVGIDDPCGHHRSYIFLVSVYIKYVINGVNYNNKSQLRSATVKGYAKAIDILFKLRNFPLPANTEEMQNPTNTAILVHNLEREETIAKQCSPIDQKIFLKIIDNAQKSKKPNSVESLFYNVTVIARYLGLRLSEYGQTTQDKVDMHVYPSGTEVVKAFTANDFVFMDAHGNIITDLSELTIADRVKLTWRIQKNRQNNQSATLAADTENPSVCPVTAALQLVLRARRLNQPDDLPVCFYTNQRSRNVYLTGSKIADLLQKVVKMVYPSISKPDLSRYSAHSFRVWACVLLDEQGKSPEYIKKRLRWLGESFRTYLRDTATIQDQHRAALNNASIEIEQLLAALPNDVVEMTQAMQHAELSEYDNEGN